MRVHLIAAGPAGRAVTDQLQRSLEAAGDRVITTEITATGPIDRSFWPTADFRVVASWREMPELIDAVDRLAHEAGTAYTQLVFEHPRLRVGPTIVPGATGGAANTSGGCQECFTKRQRQHNISVERAAALWQHYAKDRAAGPGGYLPHHIGLATALATRIANAAREQRLLDERNRIYLLNLLQGSASSNELIPVHGCHRCGTPRLDASWRDLERELGHITVRQSNEGANLHG